MTLNVLVNEINPTFQTYLKDIYHVDNYSIILYDLREYDLHHQTTYNLSRNGFKHTLQGDELDQFIDALPKTFGGKKATEIRESIKVGLIDIDLNTLITPFEIKLFIDTSKRFKTKKGQKMLERILNTNGHIETYHFDESKKFHGDINSRTGMKEAYERITKFIIELFMHYGQDETKEAIENANSVIQEYEDPKNYESDLLAGIIDYQNDLDLIEFLYECHYSNMLYTEEIDENRDYALPLNTVARYCNYYRILHYINTRAIQTLIGYVIQYKPSRDQDMFLYLLRSDIPHNLVISKHTPNLKLKRIEDL